MYSWRCITCSWHSSSAMSTTHASLVVFELAFITQPLTIGNPDTSRSNPGDIQVKPWDHARQTLGSYRSNPVQFRVMEPCWCISLPTSRDWACYLLPTPLLLKGLREFLTEKNLWVVTARVLFVQVLFYILL